MFIAIENEQEQGFVYVNFKQKMSELQKQFYKFIREAQDVDDDTLKSFIKKVDSKHIKGLLGTFKKLKSSQFDGDNELNDKWHSVKKFLEFNAPLSMKSYDNLPVHSPIEMNLPEDEMKLKLTSMIKNRLSNLISNEIDSIRIRLNIAELLGRLCEIFDQGNHKSMSEFYLHLKESLGVSKSTFCAYQQYYEFLMKYTRFQQTPIGFKDMRKHIGSLKKWFDSSECKKLSANNYCSKSFWLGNNDKTVSAANNIGESQTFNHKHTGNNIFEYFRSSDSDDSNSPIGINIPSFPEFEKSAQE